MEDVCSGAELPLTRLVYQHKVGEGGLQPCGEREEERKAGRAAVCGSVRGKYLSPYDLTLYPPAGRRL